VPATPLAPDTLPYKLSLNRTVIASREWASSASEDSLWKQVAWSHVSRDRFADGKELFDLVANEIYSLLKEHAEFDAFYTHDHVVPIPALEDLSGTRIELKTLDNITGSVGALSTDMSLALVLDHVARHIGWDEDTDQPLPGGAEEKPAAPAQPASLDDGGLLTAQINKAIGSSVGAKRYNRKIVRYYDNLSKTSHETEHLTNVGLNTSDMLYSLLDSFPMGKFQRGLKSSPSAIRNRYLNQEELRKISKLTIAESHRALIQLEFEDILGRNSQAWTLDDAKTFSPQITSRFYEREGRLLLAMHGPGAVGSQVHEGVAEAKVKTKVNFGLFHDLYRDHRHYLDPTNRLGSNPAPASALPPLSFAVPSPPAPAPAEKSDVYSAGDYIIEHADSFSVMYPSFGSSVRVHRVSSIFSGPDLYSTLSCLDSFVSWGSANPSCKSGPYLSATFPDGSSFAIGPREGGAVVASMSMPEGLLVEFRANGSVVQRNASHVDTSKADVVFGKSVEQSRVITGEVGQLLFGTPCFGTKKHTQGFVVRYLSNDVVEILYPTGKTAVRRNGIWIITTPSGERSSFASTTAANAPPSSGDFSIEPIKAICENLVALERIVVTREDLVAVTTMKHGTVLTEHADQTRFISTFAEPFVMESDPYGSNVTTTTTVESTGLATVTISQKDANKTVFLPNGATVTCSGFGDNERFGKFKIVQPSCIMEVDVNGGAKFIAAEQIHPADEVYAMDWMNGTFETTDSNGTTFKIAGDGTISAETHTEHAMKPRPPPPAGPQPEEEGLLNYLVNKPYEVDAGAPSNPPRLFVIEEDGSGWELLRDQDMIPFLKANLAHSSTSIKEEVSSEGLGTSITVVMNSETPAGPLVTYRQCVRHPPLDRALKEQLSNELKKLSNAKKDLGSGVLAN
ncbi:Sperm-associated antigen 17, partial [Irineochytrium annulatum]